MPQALAKVVIHIVFSTKDREPWLQDKPLRRELHRYMGGIIGRLDCIPIQIGGVSDHVHILTTLSRTTTIADLVKEIKRVSTVWMHGNDLRYRAFHWQSGYGVFSVSHSNIEQVVDYITTQAEHHRQVTFQDELRRFYERHDIQNT